MNTWLRTAIAILAGFLLMVIVVMVGTVVAMTLIVTEEIAATREFTVELPAGYLAANLVITLLAAAAGGWLASRLDDSGWRPIAGLAAVVLLMSLVNSRTPDGPLGNIVWYPWVVTVLGVGGVLLGGWSRLRSTQFPAQRNSPEPM